MVINFNIEDTEYNFVSILSIIHIVYIYIMESSKLLTEINSFKSIWYGGFRTGYSFKRNQKGIEEYLKHNMSGKCCLEIGCGGGQWSKYIYELNRFEKIYY